MDERFIYRFMNAEAITCIEGPGTGYWVYLEATNREDDKEWYLERTTTFKLGINDGEQCFTSSPCITAVTFEDCDILQE